MLQHFSCHQALSLLNDSPWCWLDIRALEAYDSGHIPNAIHLPREALDAFINEYDKSTPLLIYCYHGISSCSLGQSLLEAGFEQVATLDGGFSAWHAQHPSLSSVSPSTR